MTRLPRSQRALPVEDRGRILPPRAIDQRSSSPEQATASRSPRRYGAPTQRQTAQPGQRPHGSVAGGRQRKREASNGLEALVPPRPALRHAASTQPSILGGVPSLSSVLAEPAGVPGDIRAGGGRAGPHRVSPLLPRVGAGWIAAADADHALLLERLQKCRGHGLGHPGPDAASTPHRPHRCGRWNNRRLLLLGFRSPERQPHDCARSGDRGEECRREARCVDPGDRGTRAH
jgi:hypothetical protein